MAPVYLSCVLSVLACLEMPLKLKKWRRFTDEPLTHVCAWLLRPDGLVAVLRICFHCDVTLAQTVGSLEVEEWACRASWAWVCEAAAGRRFSTGPVRFTDLFSVCRPGPCSVPSSSYATFPPHWQKRPGSSFFPDCGKFCLTDSSMWVYS